MATFICHTARHHKLWTWRPDCHLWMGQLSKEYFYSRWSAMAKSRLWCCVLIYLWQLQVVSSRRALIKPTHKEYKTGPHPAASTCRLCVGVHRSVQALNSVPVSSYRPLIITHRLWIENGSDCASSICYLFHHGGDFLGCDWICTWNPLWAIESSEMQSHCDLCRG